MKNNYIKYLDTLEVTQKTIRLALTDILEYGHIICPEKIIDIFISEYINTEDKQIYEGLWMISENYMMEAKTFRTKYDIDIMKYSNSIKYVQFIVKDYDLKNASVNSSLTLKFTMKNIDMKGILKASGNNCDALYNIYEKYFKCNIV